MKEIKYDVISVGICDTSEAPIDKDIFYKCKMCDEIVPSMPKKSTGCKCGNIEIDKEMHRLWVGDYEKFIVLKKTPQ